MLAAVSGLAVLTAIVAITALAPTPAGLSVTLGDGRVWVSSDASGAVGRVNPQVGEMDAAAPVGAARLDVTQSGRWVIAVNRIVMALHRPVIAFREFSTGESSVLQDWAVNRRAGARGPSPDYLLREHGGIVLWMVQASNGRTVALGADAFASVAEAAAMASTVVSRAMDLQLELIDSTGPPAHGWAIRLDGVLRVIPQRLFSSPRLRDRNISSTMQSLSRAQPPRVIETRPITLHPDLRVELLEGEEPIKERLPPRPLRERRR